MSGSVHLVNSDGTPAYYTCGCPITCMSYFADSDQKRIETFVTRSCGSCGPASVEQTNPMQRRSTLLDSAPIAVADPSYCRRCGGPTSVAGQLCGEC